MGCNDGKLTAEIAKLCSPRMIVGIDTDAKLIESATMLGKRIIFSHEKGDFEQLQEGELVQKSVNFKPIPPSSSQISLFPRPFSLKSTNVTRFKCDGDSNSQFFPYNIKFLCKDIFQLSSSSIYDNVLCFSVVKWVHLNEGDTGLIRFFHRLYSLLKPDGSLFLEFQPWKSYISNRATSETTKSVFPTIQIRPEHFQDILTKQIGFSFEKNIGTTLAESKGYERPMYWLRKLPTPPNRMEVIVEESLQYSEEKGVGGNLFAKSGAHSVVQKVSRKSTVVSQEITCDRIPQKHLSLQSLYAGDTIVESNSSRNSPRESVEMEMKMKTSSSKQKKRKRSLVVQKQS